MYVFIRLQLVHGTYMLLFHEYMIGFVLKKITSNATQFGDLVGSGREGASVLFCNMETDQNYNR